MNRFWTLMQMGCMVLVVGMVGCGATPEEDGTEIGQTQEAGWVGGQSFSVCNGAIHVREWPSDSAPARGYAVDGTPVHSYSNYDAEDGTTGWDPAYVGGTVDTHGWVKLSHMCPR